jgi:hypothetical protein
MLRFPYYVNNCLQLLKLFHHTKNCPTLNERFVTYHHTEPPIHVSADPCPMNIHIPEPCSVNQSLGINVAAPIRACCPNLQTVQHQSVNEIWAIFHRNRGSTSCKTDEGSWPYRQRLNMKLPFPSYFLLSRGFSSQNSRHPSFASLVADL